MFGWFTDGKKATKMFGWIRKTEAGKALDEIDDIFQPLANDIMAWRKIEDIGKFSPDTMRELKEAWAVVPAPQKKMLKKGLKILQKVISPTVLMQIIELYLRSVKATI